VTERPLAFGDGARLIGTVTLPDPPAAAAPVGFVLFNAGMVHRVGPHRVNVRLARRLARRGVASIRFDLAGHGDSARLTGQHSFEEQAVVDLRAAMDALAAASGLERFAIFGLCSGAYHGYATALADTRVVGLMLFDAYRYPRLKTHLVHYLKGVRQPHFARRVLGFARHALEALGRLLPGSGRAAAPPPPPKLGAVNFIPSRAEFAAGLRKLLDRGVTIAVGYSGGEIRDYNYHGQFRDTFREFGITDRIPATFLPDIDHQASTLGDQEALWRVFMAWGDDVLAAAAPAARLPA
jgi:hypothetical protein